VNTAETHYRNVSPAEPFPDLSVEPDAYELGVDEEGKKPVQYQKFMLMSPKLIKLKV